jgi:hypothetical protein
MLCVIAHDRVCSQMVEFGDAHSVRVAADDDHAHASMRLAPIGFRSRLKLDDVCAVEFSVGADEGSARPYTRRTRRMYTMSLCGFAGVRLCVMCVSYRSSSRVRAEGAAARLTRGPWRVRASDA